MKRFLGLRPFDVLVALYVFGIMASELMGGKVMPIGTIGSFHLVAGVAIFVMPLLFTSVDVIVEVFGKERARSVVRTGLLIVGLQILTAVFFTHLPATAFSQHKEAAYDTIFGTSIRLGLASILAFATSELLDIAIFARLRQRMQGRALWLRNNVANFLSQLVDSTVFLTVAFYSLDRGFGVNAKFLIGLILPYYVVRVLFSILETPLVYLGVRWLKSAKRTAAAVQPVETIA